jgi:hypothetical protein
MIPNLNRDSGEDPVIGYDDRAMFNGREQEPQIVDEGVMKTLLDYANKMEREGNKATAQIAKRYGNTLSQRIPESHWGTPGSSVIHAQRGFLGRKDPTDVARQQAAKTIEDLHKLLALLVGNQQRFIDFSHSVLTEARRRMAERNDMLPADIRDYGRLIELIAAYRSLNTLGDCLEMIDAIGKTEIAQAMPRR